VGALPTVDSIQVEETLLPYVPRLVLDWLRTTPEAQYRCVEGSLVFVDISGFTKLAERLARKGKVGAEELSDTLNATFTELLSVAYDYGAGVIKWGGDAVLLLFDGDGHEVRSCRGAAEMQRAIRRVGRIRTESGTVVLRMSIGVNSGAFDFFLVGESHRELLVAGSAATETTLLEAVADAGEIVVSRATAEHLAPRNIGAVKGPGILLRGLPEADLSRADPVTDFEGLPIAECLPAAIRSHLLTTDREPEHRTIGVAFVEFRGTDALIRERGGEEVARMLHEVISVVQRSVEHHRITFHETDISKDGGKILLLAGAPRSAGDDEERMLRAVREIIDAEVELPRRVGVNCGPVFSGDFGPSHRRTFSVKGDAVNLAARLMGKADVGEIVASDEVVKRSRTVFALDQLEPFFVKGKSNAILAHSLGPVVGRPGATAGTPLVGRAAELATLRAGLAAARNWQGRYVEVVGEAGLGKSRLVEELRVEAEGVTVISTACAEYEASTPYFALRAPLRRLFGLEGLDDEAAAHRLAEIVQELAPRLTPWLPLVALPLDVRVPSTPEVESLTEEFRKARVEEVVQEVLGVGLLAPTLLAFEDIHWMDDASRDLLRAIVDHLEDRPWLVVATTRTTAGGLKRAHVPWATLLELAPLDGADALQVLEDATAEAPLPPHQLELLRERAQGNPLYLRELVATAQQLGGIEHLPDSVGGLIAAQIDALAPADRTNLRRAAVLGASFEARFLESVVSGISPIEFCNRLGDFLETSPGRIRFRHALVRDTAYEGLSYRRRRELHGLVGEAIAVDADGDTEAQAPLLSFHFYEAQRFDEAWRYSSLAGRRAKELYANVEAETLLRRAIESARRLRDVPARDLSASLEALGEVQLRLADYDRANKALTDARRLLREDAAEAARLMLRQGSIQSRRARFAEAIRWVRRGLKTIEGDPSPAAQRQRAHLKAWYAAIRFRQGRLHETVDWCRRAIDDATAADVREALAHAYYLLDYALVGLGRKDEAVHSDRALAIYQELGDLSEEAGVLNNLGAFAYFDGRWREAVDYYRRAEEAWERAGDRWLATMATTNRGELLADQGRLEEAEQLFKYALRVARAAGSEARIADINGFYGRLAARAGRYEEARELLTGVRDQYVAAGGRRVEVLMIDVRLAEALALEGRAAEAVAACDAALDTVASLEGLYTIMPYLLRIRGWALHEVGETDEARQVLKAAIGQAHDLKADYEIALTADVLAQVLRAGGDEDEEGDAVELEAVRDSIFDELGIKAPEAVLLPAVGVSADNRRLTRRDR
jgi:predicted ATPase/class 3 adenylate cyclase